LRKVVVSVLVLAAAPVGVAFAQSDGLKVTGGGQAIASASDPGPGDTIAFNAQQTGPEDAMTSVAPAKGQLQVQNRTGGTRFHGIVTCIRVLDVDGDPNTTNDRFIRFGGFEKVTGQAGTTPFTVDTQDNGEGAGASGDDMIYFRTRGDTEDPCDDSDPATQLRTSTLARGNVQEH
jgi:hypothetical protein